MIKQTSDFHTHTTYCDGKHSVFEMAEMAYAKSFKKLGFSGHGYTFFDESYCMSQEGTLQYLKDIEKAKEIYRGKMEIFAGVEKDYFADNETDMFDYVIGSVHYVKVGDKYYPLDESVEDMKNIIDFQFDGDFSALAEEYYTEESKLLERVDADIIGHFDLITKFQDRLNLSYDERYFESAFYAIRTLSKFHIPFEINIGAMTRGYRKEPYPAVPLLKEIKRLNCDIVFSGDCHNGEKLGCFYNEARDLALSCGFTTHLTVTKDGFEREKI